MDDFQQELTRAQKEKLLAHTCQVAVILAFLQHLEEKIELDTDLHNDVASTSFAVHTVKVKLMNLVVP